MSKHKRARAPTPPQKIDLLTAIVLTGIVIALAVMVAAPFFWWRLHDETHHRRRAASSPRPAARARSVLGGKLRLTDVAVQTREFIGYYSAIRLTSEQEAIKREVLEPMPAACCRNSNAYRCCCNCNLSKSVWGLSNYVLATHHASADELREAVTAWTAFTNPDGYSGDVCYGGGCSRAFHDNGCGGMSESKLVL